MQQGAANFCARAPACASSAALSRMTMARQKDCEQEVVELHPQLLEPGAASRRTRCGDLQSASNLVNAEQAEPDD